LKAYWVAILLVASVIAGRGATVDGDWHGVLHTGAIQLRIGVHIKRESGGTMSATFDSYDQNALGLPVDRVSFYGSRLNFEMMGLKVYYEGTLSADRIEDPGQVHARWSTAAVDVRARLVRRRGAPTRTEAAVSVSRGGRFLSEQHSARETGGQPYRSGRNRAVSGSVADYWIATRQSSATSRSS